MKTIKTTMGILLITIASMIITSCKKEDAAPKPKTTQEKIAGKWRLESSARNDFYAGVPHFITYTGTAADYVDFRNDGKVYSFVDGNSDTTAYSIISDTKMWIDSSTDVFDILTLTESTFKFYMKQTFNAGEYYETTINLKR